MDFEPFRVRYTAGQPYVGDLALRKALQKCSVATAGAFFESRLVPRRHVVSAHVESYLRDDKRLHIFLYGHTHEFERAGL